MLAGLLGTTTFLSDSGTVASGRRQGRFSMPSFRMRLCAALVVALACLLGLARPAGAVSTTITISQIYGGGGNSGAPYQNDYVELFNKSTSLVDLSGWSIQYTSATGTGNFGSSSNLITPLQSGLMLAPG